MKITRYAVPATLMLVVTAFAPATAQTPPGPPPAPPPPPPPIVTITIPPEPAWQAPADVPAEPVPVSDPASWMTSIDYPPTALRARREGRTEFEAVVDPNGRVMDCRVIATSGASDLDDATCRLVRRRARFRPAFDADRQPVTGAYRNTVVWQLPMVPTIEPHSAQFAFVVGTDGYISECQVVSMTGKVPAALLANNPCSAPVRYEPYRDADGNPVRKQVTLTFGGGVNEAPGD